MNEKICEILKKYNVQRFNLFKEDLFTYVLETEELKDEVEIDLLEELYELISNTFKVKHRVLLDPKKDFLGKIEKEMEAPGGWNNVVKNPVSHPHHYNQGRIEVIEAIEDWKVNFHRGNAIKYIARAGKKDPMKECEDLEKATWYLKREIEVLKAAKEQRTPIKPNNMPKTPASTSAIAVSTSGPTAEQMDSAYDAQRGR